MCPDGFWLGKYEVTQGQWKKNMGKNSNLSAFKGCDDRPAEMVTWHDVQKFIKKLGKENFRLPTETEWEYACRSGGKSEKYAGGNDKNLGWHNETSTHFVGQKYANGLGIYDMSGNVWEWCAGRTPDGKRVIRGGSWSSEPDEIRCVSRAERISDRHNRSTGFRLVKKNLN